ncbi:MAG: transposase [Lachnospiraceae bacterium]|nr:transposase [Lachnospiraceae bacterium]
MLSCQIFDFLPAGDKGAYQISFKVVRFLIGDNSYESIITNIPADEMNPCEIKELYHMRWGIETNFRELKYAIGLTNFHSKKVEYIKQEIYARLTLYNFCEAITISIILKIHKQQTKRYYQVNYTMDISICKKYLKKLYPTTTGGRIQRYVLPVRSGRKDPRKVKPQTAIGFLYRVA